MTDVTPTAPWHEGEKHLHRLIGVADQMEVLGSRFIRDFMPDEHREFYQQLPFMLVGMVDGNGHPWASILQGTPGFARSPDPRRLELAALPAADDPVRPGLHEGAAIGMLGIELHTRRRNRVNGGITGITSTGFAVAIQHSFGNCPQYIQLRETTLTTAREASPLPPVQRANGLDDAARALIRAADTFFVASYVDPDGNPSHRAVDVSHRGGQRGFVDVDGDRLTIPDFAGNRFFNTLGNLMVNPRAGLLFIDFSTGDLLQVTGRTEIVFEGPEVEAFAGAQRLWRVQVEAMVRRPAALKLRGTFLEYSPRSLAMGTWEEARLRLESPA